MSTDIIQERLLNYQCKTVVEQQNALKEIAQEIALMSLSRSGFFDIAAFQGGTCLRILYSLNRFSEDLDFVLEKPDPSFDWEIYIKNMNEDFSAYGYHLEVVNKKNADKSVKTAFLKAESEGGILLIKDERTNRPKLQIKLEIDSNPPEGSSFEIKYLDFPSVYNIKAQDVPSLFASKCHALLCRPFIKGRDWYDFIWYVARNTPMNDALLAHAINQMGPWAGQQLSINTKWISSQLRTKINSIDWDTAKKDVERFLNPKELLSLNVWSKDFFLSRVDKWSDSQKI